MEEGRSVMTNPQIPYTGVVYCKVLVKKCPGANSTQWRYIEHVINSYQGDVIYSVTSY